MQERIRFRGAFLKAAAGTALVLLGGLQNSGAQNAKPATSVPGNCRQIVVATGESWKSNKGRLVYYERNGRTWKPVTNRPIPVLFGRKGLAWGRGAIPLKPPSGEPVKRERDGKTPVGCFRLGRVYGYAPALPAGADYPYHRVTKWDAWSDDPKSPVYNRHVTVDPKKGIPGWFKKARMRLGDFAYEWKIEIRHNSDPPVPGAGSAIFFHIRRGPNRTTAGCTTMAKSELMTLIKWLRADANPHYVVLPEAKYAELRRAWRLPPAPSAGR